MVDKTPGRTEHNELRATRPALIRIGMVWGEKASSAVCEIYALLSLLEQREKMSLVLFSFFPHSRERERRKHHKSFWPPAFSHPLTPSLFSLPLSSSHTIPRSQLTGRGRSASLSLSLSLSSCFLLQLLFLHVIPMAQETDPHLYFFPPTHADTHARSHSEMRSKRVGMKINRLCRPLKFLFDDDC